MRPVYSGYEERYMTGQEIIDTFSNAYECYGRHHERTTAYKMDWSYKPKVKPEKTYRVFINDYFCGIFDSDTDEKLYYFGYTFQEPPWAKEGKKPPAPKYCKANVKHLRFFVKDGEWHREPEEIEMNVICDKEGNILTDTGLLGYLYDLRFIKRFPVQITDKALVSMATYKPLSKEEFINIPGVWEGIYSACGEEFIKAIQEYTNYEAERN